MLGDEGSRRMKPRVDEPAAHAIDRGGGALSTDSGEILEGHLEAQRFCTAERSVLANFVCTNDGTTCEGPGDPPRSCATGTVTWPTSAADVADAVAGGGVAAGLNNLETARAANAARGKAASGPPHGCAAPWEDTVGMNGKWMGYVHDDTSQVTPQSTGGGRPLERQVPNSPQAKPSSLGAGPSNGRVQFSEQGGRPATKRRIERRRDGGAAAAADVSAARGSDGAAALGRRNKMPLEGIDHHAHGARNSECQVLDAVQTNLGTSAPNARGAKRPRLAPASPGRAHADGRDIDDDGGNDGEAESTPRVRQGAAGAIGDASAGHSEAWGDKQFRHMSARPGRAPPELHGTSGGGDDARDDRCMVLNGGGAASPGAHALDNLPAGRRIEEDNAAQQYPLNRRDGCHRGCPSTSGSVGQHRRHSYRREDSQCGGPSAGSLTAMRMQEDEVAQHCLPSPRSTHQLWQPGSPASSAQHLLRRRRGSPEGEDPEGPHIRRATSDDEAGTGGVNSGNREWQRDAPLIRGSDCSGNPGSPSPHALRPDPRDQAHVDGDQRGDLWGGGQSRGGVTEASGLPGQQRDAGLDHHADSMKRYPTPDRAEPMVKRRRIRGKQSRGLTLAANSISDYEADQFEAHATSQTTRGGSVARAAVGRPNSLHLPASASPLRSCSSVPELLDFHDVRHGLALRGEDGAAAGTATADGSFRDVGQACTARGLGQGPSRYASHLLDVQRFPSEDHRDGPRPAARGSSSMLPWSPSGGRPPEGVSDAA